MSGAVVRGTSLLEFVLKHDRIVAIVALGAVSVLAWTYTLAGVGLGMCSPARAVGAIRSSATLTQC